MHAVIVCVESRIGILVRAGKGKTVKEGKCNQRD